MVFCFGFTYIYKYIRPHNSNTKIHCNTQGCTDRSTCFVYQTYFTLPRRPFKIIMQTLHDCRNHSIACGRIDPGQFMCMLFLFLFSIYCLVLCFFSKFMPSDTKQIQINVFELKMHWVLLQFNFKLPNDYNNRVGQKKN